MKPIAQTKVFVDVVAALFVLLFLYTAIEKLKDIPGFIGAMSRSELIGGMATVVAWVVPVTELIIVVLLIVPRLRMTGLVAATALMAVFTIYIAYILLSAKKLPCKCGGVIESLGWRDHLLLNLGFLMAGLATIFHKNIIKRFTAINRSSRIPVETSRRKFDH